MKIVILMAMEAEAAPLREQLPEAPVFTPGKCPKTGVDRVGTQWAAILAYNVCTAQRPDLILNYGTGGGFSYHNANVGDIYLGEKVLYHDRRIPLPRFEEYGRGEFPCFDPGDVGIRRGIISTGNSLDLSDLEKLELERSEAHVKEMEAAAIAEVAEHFGIPFLPLKGITDLVDDPIPAGKQFVDNLQRTAERVAQEGADLYHHLLQVGTETPTPPPATAEKS